MTGLYPILRALVCCAGVVFGLPVMHARAVVVTGPVAGSNPGKTSMAMVEGKPAIVWSNLSSKSVRYVRALDADGTAWGTPVEVSHSPTQGSTDVTLRVVNGRPAVCGMDYTSLNFVRAGDALGDEWGPPAVVFSPQYPYREAVMEIINGAPAILAVNGTGFFYHRALDAEGTAWAEPVAIPALSNTVSIDLEEVQGWPAFSFVKTGGGSEPVYFCRARDSNGTAWEEPAPLGTAVGVQGISCSLCVVEGHPAVAAFVAAGPDMQLLYARGGSPEGAPWPEPVNVPFAADALNLQALKPSLAVVNGRPAMALCTANSDFDLQYLQAHDATGDSAVAWSLPDDVDTTGDTGFQPSLLEVHGCPAIAYFDRTNQRLKYIRAVTVNTTDTRWPPELVVFRDNGASFENGDSASFGNTARGTIDTTSLKIQNHGRNAVDLQITGVSITGTDAAEFSIVRSPQSTIVPGNEAELVVAHAPVTPGSKRAELRLFSNDGIGSSPLLVRLSGISLPSISVARPGGMQVPNGSAVELPPPAPDIPLDIDLIVNNTGGSDLEIRKVTLLGANAAEFSLHTPLPAALAPGAAATLTVRHTPLAAGPKTARLYIESNEAFSNNPYLIDLRIANNVVEESFAHGTIALFSVALEPEGRILAGGTNFIAALHPDGSPDLSFFGPALNGTVLSLAVQRDGLILAGGSFTTVNGLNRRGLVRLTRDGSGHVLRSSNG